MLGRLPLALLALLSATVAHSAEPTSLHDPFRHLVLRNAQKQNEPICCLRPPPPLEVVGDDVLLSFEEWKVRQSQIQRGFDAEPPDKSSGSPGEFELKGDRIRNGEDSPIAQDDSAHPTQANTTTQRVPEALSPHFRVPITDRFNYASLDCSARVHTAHKGAKSSSSILSSKKDRYMLSPCVTPNVQQFVVVELCEDIRIDTVQLANFEFFSGVFKDFSVSVAKTYNGPWQDAGTYRAKNIRGVQSFHTSSTLRDFYRYIRIDFHTHYGKEHYCPLSLLRVYGLTHLEEWKWELWEAESKSQQEGIEGATRVTLSVDEPIADHSSATAKPDLVVPPASSDILTIPHPDKPIILGSASQSELPANATPSNPAGIHSTLSANVNDQSKYPDDTIPSSHMQTLHTKDSYASSLNIVSSSTATPSSSSTTAVSDTGNPSLPEYTPPIEHPHTSFTSKPVPSQVDSTPTISSSVTRSTAIPTSSPSSASTNGSPSHPPSPHMPPVASGGGESIYRTIMNRLQAIESSHTLYTRYIDQQNGAIRNVIKQLGEDIGRLEAATRTQRTAYQKAIGQWEKERVQMIMEYNQMRSKVDHLTEEIVLEKRLGVFQLVLLLAVLVFLGLTRGSRGEAIVVSGSNGTVREWSRRNLSLSGDWGRFVGRSTSRGPLRTSVTVSRPSSPSKVTATLHSEDKIHFPRSDHPGSRNGPVPFEPIQLNTAPLPHEYRAIRQKKNSFNRSRTPSLRTGGVSATIKRTPHTAVSPRSGTPTPVRASHLRPQLMHRGSSHGPQSISFPGGPAPKGARKWARSAHLHPAKPLVPREWGSKEVADENIFSEGMVDDVFSAPAGSSRFPKSVQNLASRTPKQIQPERQKHSANEGNISIEVLGEEVGIRRAPLRVLSYSGDDKDTESNWADTDSVVGSDAGDTNYSEVDALSESRGA